MANERLKRTKPSTKRSGLADSIDYSYNESAGAIKSLGPVMGKLIPLGNCFAGIAVGSGKLIAVFNDGGNTEFIAMGITNPAVPASPAIALPSKSYTILATGDDTYVRGSAVHVLLYLIEDDTVYTP